MAQPENRSADWTGAALRRPLITMGAMVAFAGAGFASLVASCNVHEFGHAAVATVLGWRVERINLCLPRAGSVEYSHVGTWAGNIQGYAGGFAAALFLFVLYKLVFSGRSLPLRSPVWWAAGLGAVVFIGPQLLIAVLEGLAGPGEDYTEGFRESPAVFVPLLVSSSLLGAAVYTWRWRSVWRHDR